MAVAQHNQTTDNGTHHKVIPSGSKTGRPPLPTSGSRGGKKETTKKKASAKVASAAKRSVADAANATVKLEPSDLKGTGKTTDEEDLFICKACVSCSTDPIVGAEQKGEKFWKSVHEKTYVLCDDEAEVVVQAKRPWDSIRNRFQKTLSPSVQKFNAHCKQAVQQNESGWTKQMCIEAAMKTWEEIEGKPHKFSMCTRVLHQLPKFNPMTEEEEDGKPAAEVNPVGEVMGSEMERPIGTKKAKKQKLLDKLEMGSVASSAAVDAMAKSSVDMTNIMARRQQHDSLAKRADLCLKMGVQDKALEMIQMMEADDSKPIGSSSGDAATAATVPKNIEVPEGNNAEEEEDDDSHHSSQPSDDSKLVKKNPSSEKRQK